MRDSEMFLERALVEDGLLDAGQLAEVRRFAAENELDLVDALTQSGRLSPREIATARAARAV